MQVLVRKFMLIGIVSQIMVKAGIKSEVLSLGGYDKDQSTAKLDRV
ncbi:MAG: hypothetical protein WCC17_25555 [Candidatus Nitrosopolaris sp.]